MAHGVKGGQSGTLQSPARSIISVPIEALIPRCRRLQLEAGSL